MLTRRSFSLVSERSSRTGQSGPADFQKNVVDYSGLLALNPCPADERTYLTWKANMEDQVLRGCELLEVTIVEGNGGGKGGDEPTPSLLESPITGDLLNSFLHNLLKCLSIQKCVFKWSGMCFIMGF